MGLPIRTFASAEEFLAMQEDSRCVISDIQMPGMSGIQLATHLSSAKPTTPVILVTAYVDALVEARAADCGAAFVLKKPFTAEQLIHCVDSVLSS